jgi:acyl-CoA synthetase (AMP-forming)/AMP-acid ligase II
MAMDFLAQHAARQPNRAAVVLSDGPTLTYSELDRQANRLANAMLALGLGSLDKCTTVGYNSTHHLVVSSAGRRIVLVSLPMNYRLTPEEIEYQLNHSDTKILFSGPEQVEKIESVAARCPNVLHKVAWGMADVPAGWIRYDDLAQSGSEEPPPIEAGMTGPSMTYTAGTTGNPKGAYRANPVDPESIQKQFRWFDLRPGDVHLAAGPLYHSAPGSFAGLHLILGGTAVLMRRFDPELALQLIQQHRVNNTFMAPTLLKRIVSLPDAVKRSYDVSSMHSIVVAAAPCPFEVKRRVMELFGPVLYEFYGASETGVNTLMRPEEQLQKPGSCGRVVDGVDMKILDDAGNECPRGTAGEIWVKTTSLITEYYRNPKATADARKGEYFSVGDVAYLDDDGFVFVVDRKRDMVISGGVNICTTEIENVIHAHPKVWDVVVIGIPDEEWGESVHAIVQPKPGDMLEPAEIATFVKDHLADYKKPRSIEIRSELPRDEAGKIRKRELREPFWAGHEKRV